MTDYSIGAWFGYNYTNVMYSGKYHIGNSILVKTNYYPTIVFGLSGSYQKTDDWSFQTELNIDKKGMNYTYNSYSFVNGTRLTNSVNSNLELNYYSLPLMAKFHFGRVTKWYLTGGIVLSHLKTANIKGDMDSQYINSFNQISTKNIDLDYIVSSSYRSDVGVMAGMGYMLPLDKGPKGAVTNLIFDIRYSQGLINVFTGDPEVDVDPLAEIDPNIEVIIDEPVNSGLDLKTSVFTFKIGLVFNI